MTRDNQSSPMRDSYAYRYLHERSRSRAIPINAGEVAEYERGYPGWVKALIWSFGGGFLWVVILGIVVRVAGH